MVLHCRGRTHCCKAMALQHEVSINLPTPKTLGRRYETIVSMVFVADCPVCGGPIRLDSATVSLLVEGDVHDEQAPGVIEAVTREALWAAVRCLETAASGARLRMTLSTSSEALQRCAGQHERDAAVLRRLLSVREEPASGEPT